MNDHYAPPLTELHDALAFLDEYEDGDELFSATDAVERTPYTTPYNAIRTTSFPTGQAPELPPPSPFAPPELPTFSAPTFAQSNKTTNCSNNNFSNTNANKLYNTDANANNFTNANSNSNDDHADDDDDDDDGADADGSSSSSSPTAAAQSTTGTSTHTRNDSASTTRITKPSGPKRVRKRQKDELIYLRSRVNELEDRLERLHKKSRLSSPTSTSTPLAPVVASPPSPEPVAAAASKPSAQLASVWEKVAASQSTQRQQAEIENAKLKEMLEEQIRVAKSLERLLKRRANAELLHPNKNGNSHVKWNRVATKDEEALLFQDMLRGLDHQYDEANEIFTYERFGRRGAIFRDIQVCMSEDGGADSGAGGAGGEEAAGGEIYVDVLDSKILPFDLASTSAAFWKHMTKAQSSNDNPAMTSLARNTVELTDDTMAKTFAVEIQAGPMKGEFRGKQCVRRYMEDDNRVVIVWNMLAEPINFNGMFMGGLLMRQRVYIELTRSKEDPTQATQMRARYVMTPDVYDDEDEAHQQKRKVGAMTDFVIHMTHGNLNASHQMIENILIQSSLLKNGTADA